MLVDTRILTSKSVIQLSLTLKNILKIVQCNFLINRSHFVQREHSKTPFRYFILQTLTYYTDYCMGQVLATFTSTEIGTTPNFYCYNRTIFFFPWAL